MEATEVKEGTGVSAMEVVEATKIQDMEVKMGKEGTGAGATEAVEATEIKDTEVKKGKEGTGAGAMEAVEATEIRAMDAREAKRIILRQDRVYTKSHFSKSTEVRYIKPMEVTYYTGATEELLHKATEVKFTQAWETQATSRIPHHPPLTYHNLLAMATAPATIIDVLCEHKGGKSRNIAVGKDALF